MESKVKILITVEGGIVQSVCASSADVEIAIVDYDKHSDDPVCVSVPSSPDVVFSGHAWEQCFTGKLDEDEKAAQEELKKHRF